MDRRLALGALTGGPLLLGLLLALGAALSPLVAWGLGLAAYWAAMAGAMARFGDPQALRALIVARSPGRLVAVALALPVVVLGAGALRSLGETPLPAHLILAAAIAAVLNATLEETFWRGALAPAATPRALGLALGLYGLFHLAWLGLRGLETGTPPALLLAGAVALGGVWTASRLTSGTLGAGIVGHAGVNLFLYVDVIARNLHGGAAGGAGAGP